ncbi:MAG: phosphoenolpyruvate synthase, partial [Candidatus Sungbacteria bacterium]|nr:phosphoenolpyruvate synthase [Candidatus Sungbacteria bacterium]
NAALGELVHELKEYGIRVPDGFAVTVAAYHHFCTEAGIVDTIKDHLARVDRRDIATLKKHGTAIRQAFMNATFPTEFTEEIMRAYRELCKKIGKKNPRVAVRSSATAEDLPGASFAGQQESFLHVSGEAQLLEAVKKCFASLFTDRAIAYRIDKGFVHEIPAISVGVQHMVHADTGAAGTLFTIDPETGFGNIAVVHAAWGLGEALVQGRVIPDEFIVFKPLLKQHDTRPVLTRILGEKSVRSCFIGGVIKEMPVADRDRRRFCLTDDDVLLLARWSMRIEKHFSKKHGRATPMDIEWAKDGITGELFIVQARPETVHAVAGGMVHREYRMMKKGTVIAEGVAVGKRIASGVAQHIMHADTIQKFRKGSVLVTTMTDPDWEPIMKSAAAIVTDRGGRTSHAAIISRELGIPCIVGAKTATHSIKNGQPITVDCSSGTAGFVYKGKIPFMVKEEKVNGVKKLSASIMVNIGSADEAFGHHYLPTEGVGLGRLEFIISAGVKIHPRALIDFTKLKRSGAHAALIKKIDAMTNGVADKERYYVDTLAQGIAKIAAVAWPHPAIIRFSDFKTNEYRTLVGGDLYEPVEENPMLGWRGASRYYDPAFERAFALECAAIRKVRSVMGLTNIIPMIPFCRTPEEGRRVVKTMARYGLDRTKDPTLKIYIMCEIPSNVLQADEFLDSFDGMSIGSNDLTQLTLGLDRDSHLVSSIANENNESVKELIRIAIRKCRARDKYIGICGQAPSDHPDFAEFLIKEGISSISLNPDTVISTIVRLAKK